MKIENEKGKKKRFNMVEVDEFDSSEITEDELLSQEKSEQKEIINIINLRKKIKRIKLIFQK